MTAPLIITNKQARHLFLTNHGLANNPRTKQTKEELLKSIESLGFVQVDSIRTVERAHHMILFARNQTYRPDHLTALLEEDRHLFEHWTHDASIIPTKFFPIWRMRFKAAEKRLQERWDKRGRSAFKKELDHVISHIEEHGPTLSRTLLKDDDRKKKGQSGWWDWHPRKTALEYLWRTGVLSVESRDGFQKVYDLSERVIPAPQHDPDLCPDLPEFIDWCCRQALTRLGFATHGELSAFWDLIKPAQAKQWMEENQHELIPVEVESADGSAPRKSFAFPDIEDQLTTLPGLPQQVRIISPFDPILRDRKRAKRLFDFDYRIEIFVPEAKRKYGYYVFPLLEGDKLIGRIDTKTETVSKDEKVLRTKNIWLEEGVRKTAGRDKKIEAELNRIAKFAGAHRHEFAS